jgi:hypothetical protein
MAAVSETTRPPVDWPRAADGLQMAGFAVFLLLNTTGRLPWSFWLDAIALWPVLVMSAGLRIAFERTRAPWLLLLGPALVLGSLAWLASGAARPEPALLGPWTQQMKPRAEGVRSLRFGAQLTGARLQATATDLDPATLVEVRSIDRTGGARVETRSVGDQAELRLDGGVRQGLTLALPGRRQHWDVRLPASLPTTLDLNGVGLRAALDLTRGHLSGGRVNGVFLGVRLELPATEAPVTLRFGGVFDALHVSVPEGTPVVVHGAGLPFNAIDRGVAGAPGRAGYEIKLEGIFTALAVDARPGEPHEASPSSHPKAEADPPHGH